MSDELQRQALARSIAVRLHLLSHRDLLLVDEVVIRLCQRASESPRSRVAREAIDDLIAGVEASLVEQDAERAEGREAARVEMLGAGPACSTCSDSHRMALGDREVMCTRCPVPCEACRERSPGRGAGAYCAATPCACGCHARRTREDAPAAEFAPDQHLTRVSPDSAVIALGDERARDEELEVDVELDSEPGDQFADLADEWDRSGDVGGGA